MGVNKIDSSRPYHRFKYAVVLKPNKQYEAVKTRDNLSSTAEEKAPADPRVNPDIYLLDGGSY